MQLKYIITDEIIRQKDNFLDTEVVCVICITPEGNKVKVQSAGHPYSEISKHWLMINDEIYLKSDLEFEFMSTDGFRVKVKNNET